MKLTKILALLLAAVFCVSALFGCVSSDPDEDEIIEEDEEDEEDEEEEEDKKKDEDEKDKEESKDEDKDNEKEDVGNFLNANYKNEEFTFLHLRQLSGTRDYYGGRYLDSETYSGVTIEDAVYDRNTAVEKKYKVQIVERIEDGEEPLSFLQTAAFADDYTYDVVYGWGYKLGACVVEGFFADISALPNVDLTQEYWGPSAMDDLTINGKLYLTPSDISMNKLDWASLVFFNKQIVEDYNVTANFGGKTFYELVYEGDWTIDNFLQAVQLVSNDVDGDGSISGNDVYGLIDGAASGENYGLGCGINLTSKNDDGSYEVSYYNDTNYALAAKINEVFTNKKYVKAYSDLPMDDGIPDGMDMFEYYRSFFTKGHALFTTGAMNLTSEFRYMEDEYGILPMPKCDNTQENYISTVDSCAAVFAIPAIYNKNASTAGPERTGAILEYMSYKSNEIVLPAYMKSMIKRNGTGSIDDQKILKMIHSSTHYEFSYLMLNDTPIPEAYQRMFSSPTTSASTYRSKSKVMQAALDDFYMEMLAVEDMLD